MHRLAAMLVIVLLGLVAPHAQAQIGPNVPKPLTEDPPPPPAPQKFDDDGGLTALHKVLIFGSAALVLGAIGFVIVRDARRAAPADDRPRGGVSSAAAGGGAAKSARERERQQRAKRAKAKAARQQRKRNRP